MTLDTKHISDILRTILVNKTQDKENLENLVSTLIQHDNNFKLDTLLTEALQAWNPTHFILPLTYQWIQHHLASVLDSESLKQICQEKVSLFILQGHFHLAKQLDEFCPDTWSMKTPVTWITESVSYSLVHHFDFRQAQEAMQALLARHLAVDTTAQATVYFYEDLARHYFLRAKEASPGQLDWKSMSDAMRQWNQDFSFEMIRLNHKLNDHKPDPVTVFRGINLDQSWHEEMAHAWFNEGHAALSKDQRNCKFLQLDFTTPLNADKAWEIVGTYTSLDANTAASFAVGVTSYFKGASILFEPHLPEGSIGVCGKFISEAELIIPEMAPDIIYVLDREKRILDLYRHPDHPELVPRYAIGDHIHKLTDDQQRYRALQCRVEPQTRPQMPDMLDDYYGFPVPEPVDQCEMGAWV